MLVLQDHRYLPTSPPPPHTAPHRRAAGGRAQAARRPRGRADRRHRHARAAGPQVPPHLPPTSPHRPTPPSCWRTRSSSTPTSGTCRPPPPPCSCCRTTGTSPPPPHLPTPPHTAELLADALKQHADLGDVQTAATAMLVLQDHRYLPTSPPPPHTAPHRRAAGGRAQAARRPRGRADRRHRHARAAGPQVPPHLPPTSPHRPTPPSCWRTRSSSTPTSGTCRPPPPPCSCCRTTGTSPPPPHLPTPPHTAELLADALKQHADLGDVQTAATAMLVLQDHRYLPTSPPPPHTAPHRRAAGGRAQAARRPRGRADRRHRHARAAGPQVPPHLPPTSPHRPTSPSCWRTRSSSTPTSGTCRPPPPPCSCCRTTGTSPPPPHLPTPPHIAELLADALKQHADLGDVQTAATAMLVLQDHRNDLFPYIDEGMQENWLLGYIDILQRHKLWNVATEVIRNAWLSSVWTISQQSTTVAMCCGRCGRRTRPHSACDRCQPRQLPEICAVCHEVSSSKNGR
ncbi:unnamed protein product [Diatraea saccharalis]|uniref:Uncharacterized protein n=1 Tax=Diatraea saccharalis TaxID=40085 RepID=A0A9N9R0E9_9NEOP|nr:unnamed protein product [Diatraea saccharalis]